MIRSIFILAATFALTGTVYAASGTPEDQRACGGSVQQYCARDAQYGDMAILSCLKQNRLKIARACQMVLVKYGQ